MAADERAEGRPRNGESARSLRSKIAPSIRLRTAARGRDDRAWTGADRRRTRSRPEAIAGGVERGEDREERQFALVMMVLRNPGMRPYVARTGGRRRSATPMSSATTGGRHTTRSHLRLSSPARRQDRRRRPCRNTQISSLQRRGNQQIVNGIACPRSTGRSSFVAQRSRTRVSARKTSACLRRFIDAFLRHLGPATELSDDMAKRAFQLLHRRYGDSEWASGTSSVSGRRGADLACRELPAIHAVLCNCRKADSLIARKNKRADGAAPPPWSPVKHIGIVAVSSEGAASLLPHNLPGIRNHSRPTRPSRNHSAQFLPQRLPEPDRR